MNVVRRRPTLPLPPHQFADGRDGCAGQVLPELADTKPEDTVQQRDIEVPLRTFVQHQVLVIHEPEVTAPHEGNR